MASLKELLNEAPDRWLFEKFGKEIFKGEKEASKKLIQDFISTQSKLPFIVTVAGTNGKGETCLILQKILIDKGLSVCTFTSPHVLSPIERFSFNGDFISASEMMELFESSGQEEHGLSYYEFLFYQFIKWCFKKQPDVLILEVGLGGRLDAVNYFDANLTALTSISRDHTEFLGNTYREILFEKLGVTRKGSPLVSAVELRYLSDRIKSYCASKEVPLEILSFQKAVNFQTKNKALAKRLGELILKGFGLNDTVTLPSKMRTWARGQKVTIPLGSFILFGSHNIDGLRELAHSVKNDNQEVRFNNCLLGFSRKTQEEVESCLKVSSEMEAFVEKFCICNFNHERATPKDILKTSFQNIYGQKQSSGKFIFIEQLDEYFDAFTSSEAKEVLVAGSYYFLASFLRALLLRYPAAKFS